ncbi:uncharacterized protein LOC110231012, partial [Arabidopsis lyrata subsp. lyrata]|uniref:uncharacterized protein LOC110231012 n=1 Tax=Arabidopsis lyrata subsp. lyrata TaxID=81972 RepID=UPI000A29CB83
MNTESQTLRDDMTDTSSDRGTDIGAPAAPDAPGLPPLNPVAVRAELDPSRRLLFTPNTGMESDAAHAVPAPGAPTTLVVAAAAGAAAAVGATECTAPGHARAAHQGTHMDDLVQTILDRLDNQDARTTERIDALVAAQVASQSQIERLRRRRRTSQPHDNQEELQSPRTPVAGGIEVERRGPASIIVGSIDEHPRQNLPHGENMQSAPNLPHGHIMQSAQNMHYGPNLASAHHSQHGHHLQSGHHLLTGHNQPSGHNLLSNRAADSGRLLPGRPFTDDNHSHDQELTRLNALIRDMSSKMHRATTAAPELEKVLEETQRSPFTARLSAVHVRYVNKVNLVPYNGLTDPKIFLKSMCIAINRAHFTAEESDAGSCQLFVENLTGDALNWFSRLEVNSINSYRELTAVFLQHHSVFMIKEATNADLWTMSQKESEPLRTFIERFKKVVSNIAITDDAAIGALRNALLFGSRFREDLIIARPSTLDDALHRANRYIEIEEEKAAMVDRQPKASNSKGKA